MPKFLKILALLLVGCSSPQPEQPPVSSAQIEPADQLAIAASRDPADPTKLKVPTTLAEALAELDHMLPNDFKDRLRATPERNVVLYHDSLGGWLRNNWRLWGGGPLAQHFAGLGIFHPDDMSAIVLDSYWRHLNRRPIDLSSQIKFYQDYWQEDARKPELAVR